MFERHIAYLDGVSVLIRLRHHKAMSRAELVRALIEFMERSSIDFTRFASLAELTDYLTAHFRRSPRRGRAPLLLKSSILDPVRAAEDPPVEVVQAEARRFHAARP